MTVVTATTFANVAASADTVSPAMSVAEFNAQRWRRRYLAHRTTHNRRMAEVWTALAGKRKDWSWLAGDEAQP